METEGQENATREPDIAALASAHSMLRNEPQRALLELRELAARGSKMSMIHLGSAHRKGVGTPVDFKEAEQWYRRAADAGSLLALYLLGRLYIVEGRLQEARAEFEVAADKRYVPALHFLGRMYIAGKGGAKDTEKGKQLLLRASNAGSVFAKAALGRLLIRDGFGPRQIIAGSWLLVEALFGSLVVTLREGLTSERLR